MTTNQDLIKKANELFTYFEFNKFNNELSHCRRMNLLFEFCDYVAGLKDWELAELLESESLDDAVRFRKIINQGADLWLGDLIKTISY